MKHTELIKAAALILLFCKSLTGAGEEYKLLWEIGRDDNNNAEFALAPNKSGEYSGRFPYDVMFVVGQSATQKDWSYIQPGPVVVR